MKILLLNQAFHPDTVATGQYCTDLARYLRADGHEVSVICDRRDYQNRSKSYASYEEWEGIRVHRLRTPGWQGRGLFSRVLAGVSYDLLSAIKLLSFPRQDAIIGFTSPPLVGLHGALFKRLRGGRFIHWLMNVNHEMAMELGYLRRGSLLSKVLSAIYRFTLRTADCVVVMDEWMKKRAVENTGIDPNKIAVIPLWPAHTPAAETDQVKEESSLREKLGLTDKFVIVHAGNLSYVHPIDTVLEAAVRLKDAASIRFVFIGNGQREGDIDRYIHQHGLKNILKLPHQPREALGSSIGFADLQLIVMGDSASGLAHSSKIYSILASGRPYLFIGPEKSHVVSDVLNHCNFGFHVNNGDVDGVLTVIDKVKKLTSEELAMYRARNIAFVSSHFNRELLLEAFSRCLRSGGDFTTARRARRAA